MKKVNISKHIKTNAEKILVIGQPGSGIESRLLNHNIKQIERFIIYQDIDEMKKAKDEFWNYDCIIIFSGLPTSNMEYLKNFLFFMVIAKDNKFSTLYSYLPDMTLPINQIIVYKRYSCGYAAYTDKKLKVKFLNSCKNEKSNDKISNSSCQLNYIKAKERSTGKIVCLNSNINDTYFDTLMRSKFASGELMIIEGTLPDKWK